MNVINRNRKQGMSLLPVLALSAVLSAMLLVATNYKTTASQEDLTQRKLAATSAINMAAVDLRSEGSLPAEKSINVDGVQVTVRSALGPDGNTMKISADGQGEIVQATAVREVAQTPAAPVLVASASNSGAPVKGYEQAGASFSYIASAGAAPQAIRSKADYATAGAAPQTIGTPGGWVVFNADNVIISKDSANREAILEAVAAKEEAARQAAAAAEAARVDAINAENARVAAAQAAAEQAVAQAQAQAAAYEGKMAVYRDAIGSFTGTVSPSGDAAVADLMKLFATARAIKSGQLTLSGIYATPMGPGGMIGQADGWRF